MMTEDEKISIDKLKDSLENKTPALLLGAGFSYGAVNGKGNKIPLGTDLTKILYDRLFFNKKDVVDDNDREEAKKFLNDSNLRGMCNVLMYEHRIDERNAIFEECFSDASISENSPLFKILSYSWREIFTLNIDCLLEYIFAQKKKKYNLWINNSEKKRTTKDPLIVKLHGSVYEPESYVFDDNEYDKFLNDDNCLLRDFADAFVKTDMIFIGTQFQEEDLNKIISRYCTKEFDIEANDYYFIVPDEIKNNALRHIIIEKPNFHHIKWNTEDFFDFLDHSILSNKTLETDLKEKGLISLDGLAKDDSYESRLYTGVESTFSDFTNDWDFINPKINEFENNICSYKRALVATIVGNSYVGKTCAAKRILVDLRQKGFKTYVFRLHSSERMHLFLQYISNLGNDIKVAVLFENAAYYYQSLYNEVISKCPKNVEKLIILSSDDENEFEIRKYPLSSADLICYLRIDEKISLRYAQIIYDKLKEKHWLSNPALSGENRYATVGYIRNTNDIIEFLYNISFGKGFESHYRDTLMNADNEKDILYLKALIVLQLLGIEYVPKRILPSLVKGYKGQLNIKKFTKTFGDIILDTPGMGIKVRCLRLIKNVLFHDVDDEFVKGTIYNVVKQTQGQFNENEYNMYSELFQKSLRVKRIQSEELLSNQSLEDLFNRLQYYAEDYSYYWIQRGIIAEDEKQYDMAYHYFNEGLRIHPNSYQAKHAMAKNMMEWAIDSASSNEQFAKSHMKIGNDVMHSIIDNPAYSRGYQYSLHALIDLNLKYCERVDTDMSEDEMSYICDKILALKNNQLDNYLMNAIEHFKQYCEHNEYYDFAEKLNSRPFDNIIDMTQSNGKQYQIDFLENIN